MLSTKWTRALLPIMALSVFMACQKDISYQSTEPIPNVDLTTKVTARNVSGFVTDENNMAVQGASVKIGSTTILTDEFGYFEARNALVVKNAATVVVTQPGYFKGIKTFIAAEGKNAFFRIKLIPKVSAGTVDGASGGSITTGTGLKISFPAAAVVNASSNAAYTGPVNVAAYWIDPTASDLTNIMPGDLRGIDASNGLKILTTYGMAAVELTGAGGELLQIASGKKANLSFPIPASISATAPASIPLWSFDEVNGLWKEEGSATKTGSTYVGDVNHFSFWNCDVPANYVQFDVTLHTSTGQPLTNAFVKLSLVNNPQISAGGFTDTSGYVAGAVYANQQIKMEVFPSWNCGQAVYTQTFTTTTSNLSLGIVSVTIPVSNYGSISGSVTNCTGAPVSNGFVVIQTVSGNYHVDVINGSYGLTRLLCNGPETVGIIAVDVDAVQQNAAPVTATINSASNTIADVQACGLTSQEFLNITVNGTPKNYVLPGDSLAHFSSGNSTNFPDNTIWAYDGSQESMVTFTNVGIVPGGTQTLKRLIVPLISDSLVNISSIQVNISEYGNVGQFIAGNFSGTLIGRPPTNTTYVVSSSFRVRRSF